MTTSRKRPRGSFFREMHRVLLEAFPTKQSLAMMVKFELNKNLDEIACGAGLSEVVFTLICYMESIDQVTRLLNGAYKHNPTNRDLRDFVKDYRRIKRSLRRATSRTNRRTRSIVCKHDAGN